MNQQPINLFIISGPSGSGQDSIIEGLKKHLVFERVITTTTREMRPGESEGIPYYFISFDEFRRKIDCGMFAEYAQEYNGHFYGVTKSELQRVLHCEKRALWKMEWQGVMKAKKIFPNIKSILITVSDLTLLDKRLRRRDPNRPESYYKDRAEYTKEWMKHVNLYDFVVYNEEGRLEESICQVRGIINHSLTSPDHEKPHPPYPTNRP